MGILIELSLNAQLNDGSFEHISIKQQRHFTAVLVRYHISLASTTLLEGLTQGMIDGFKLCQGHLQSFGNAGFFQEFLPAGCTRKFNRIQNDPNHKT